jgi:hypothetical protein
MKVTAHINLNYLYLKTDKNVTWYSRYDLIIKLNILDTKYKSLPITSDKICIVSKLINTQLQHRKIYDKNKDII